MQSVHHVFVEFYLCTYTYIGLIYTVVIFLFDEGQNAESLISVGSSFTNICSNVGQFFIDMKAYVGEIWH